MILRNCDKYRYLPLHSQGFDKKSSLSRLVKKIDLFQDKLTGKYKPGMEDLIKNFCLEVAVLD